MGTIKEVTVTRRKTVISSEMKSIASSCSNRRGTGVKFVPAKSEMGSLRVLVVTEHEKPFLFEILRSASPTYLEFTH